MDVLPGHDSGCAAKTRRNRTDRIRTEARAEPDQLIQVREYLHPQIERGPPGEPACFDEITDTMPARLGSTLRRSTAFQRLVRRW
ncbi:hypothetical protein IU483_28125 [Streptomyces gardneri]|nr:hypothetical protein [Streptomyces gardneri]